MRTAVRVQSLILGLLSFLVVPLATAAPLPPASFTVAGNRVVLRASEHLLAVRFEDGASNAERRERLAAAGFVVVQEPATYFGYFMVRTPDAGTARGALRALPGVVHVAPTFDQQNDQPVHRVAGNRILVMVREGTTEAAVRRIAARAGLRYVEARKGPGFDYYVLDLPWSEADRIFRATETLNSLAEVAVAQPDFESKIVKRGGVNDPLRFNQWYLDRINADEAWAIQPGAAPLFRIAIVDDGVERAHEDLFCDGPWYDGPNSSGFGDPNVWPNACLLPGTCAADNHGTACAGIAGARANNSLGIAGVCYNASIVPIRIANGDDTTTDWQIQGFQTAASFASVISCSWGFSHDDFLEAAINGAATSGRNGKGCVVVFASGNAGASSLAFPENLASVVAVGATNQSNSRWPYSNYGPGLEIVAPSGDTNCGGDITTTDLMRECGVNNDPFNGNYETTFGGTSAACPVVAGVAGLILSKNPGFSREDVVRILQNTAFRPPQYNANEYGAGIVDAGAAVAQAANPPVDLLLTSPNSGSFLIGTPMTITWLTSWDLDPIRLYVSRDNGVSWQEIYSVSGPPGTIVPSYTWTVTGPASSQCRIKVEGNIGNAVFPDASNSAITIMADPDTDNDGINDDGDNSSVAGDHPCTGGQTTNCDDNCVNVPNPTQADCNANGVGDVCDAEYSVVGPITPAANAVGATNAYVTATFCEAMNAATIGPGSIVVRSSGVGPLDGTVYFQGGVAYFVPDNPFPENEQITVTLKSSIATADGSPDFPGYSWSFRTDDCSHAVFKPRTDHPTSPQPIYLESGDLNGDGHSDIVTSSVSSVNKVSVLLNNGLGGFPSWTDLNLGGSQGPIDPTLGDFDGDGDLDLGVACFVSDTYLLLANSGLGAFTVAYSHGIPDINGGSDMADFDSDGDLDFVVSVGGALDDLEILYNSGNGSIASSVTLAALDNPGPPTAADLNNDGALDIVVGHSFAGQFSVFLNNGQGGFARSDFNSIDPRELEVADFDGDGYLDVATYSSPDEELNIFHNDGNGAFALVRVVHPVGGWAIAAVDLDSDGDVDLATGNHSETELGWVENEGGNNFTSHLPLLVSRSGADVTTADADGDGSRDVLIVNQYDYQNSFSVIRNTGPPEAPVLVTPAPGQTMTAPAAPVLDCADAATATFYHFQIDDDPNFGSPLSSYAFLPTSQWTVSPALGAATYHWRARAGNPCDFGPWSASRILVVQSQGGGGGCPFLDTGVAGGWQEENSILRRSNTGEMRLDLYKLVHAPDIAADGTVRLRVREDEQERTRLSEANLLVVDRAADQVSWVQDGRVVLGRRVPVSSVRSAGGEDLTRLLSDPTAGGYEGLPGTVLYVELHPGGADAGGSGPGEGKPRGLIIRPSKKEWSAAELPRDDERILERTGIVVERPDGRGGWVEVSHLHPRENAADLAVNAEREVRLVFVGRHRIHDLSWVRVDDETPPAASLSPRVAAHSLLGDVRHRLSARPGTEVTLSPGERIELEFRMPPPVAGRDRDFYFAPRGVYTTLEPGSPAPRDLPGEIQLSAAHPNPSSQSVSIGFALPEAARVRISVYDLAGRLVSRPVDDDRPAGHHSVTWNLRNHSGSRVPAGLYLYRMEVGHWRQERKLVVQ